VVLAPLKSSLRSNVRYACLYHCPHYFWHQCRGEVLDSSARRSAKLRRSHMPLRGGSQLPHRALAVRRFFEQEDDRKVKLALFLGRSSICPYKSDYTHCANSVQAIALSKTALGNSRHHVACGCNQRMSSACADVEMEVLTDAGRQRHT